VVAAADSQDYDAGGDASAAPVDTVPFVRPMGYKRVDGDGDAGPCGAVDVLTVSALIEARAAAKLAKEYDSADAMAIKLRTEHAVVLNDQARTWRVVLQSGGYFRVGPEVDPLMAEQVGDLLERRSAHQLKEYEQADAIHAELTALGVVLDTHVKSWKRPALGGNSTRGRARQSVCGDSKALESR
jgi:hypothetical protein